MFSRKAPIIGYNKFCQNWNSLCKRKQLCVVLFDRCDNHLIFSSTAFSLTTKAWPTKETIVQLDFLKIENFCASKNIINKVKRQPTTEWEKISSNHLPEKDLYLEYIKISGLPWWRSGWESACQCRGHGFEPWSGKIPHAVEQLNPWATTTEPARLEPVLHNERPW